MSHDTAADPSMGYYLHYQVFFDVTTSSAYDCAAQDPESMLSANPNYGLYDEQFQEYLLSNLSTAQLEYDIVDDTANPTGRYCLGGYTIIIDELELLIYPPRSKIPVNVPKKSYP